SAAPPSLCRIGLVFNLPPSADGQWSQYYRAWQAEAGRFNARESSLGGSKRSFSFHSPAGSGKDELEAAVESGCMAGLIFTMHPSHWSNSPILTKPGIPRVTIVSLPVDRIPTITFDSRALLAKGLDWFAANGRRRVAFIIGSSASHADELIAAVAARGMITHRHWVQGVDVGHPHWAATCAETLARLKAAERPDALLVEDDNFLPPASRGLLAAGIRVPQDILLAAHCNFPYPTPSLVPVKRFGNDVSDLLELSVSMIFRQHSGQAVPEFTVMPAHSDDDDRYANLRTSDLQDASPIS
ncbi:MAG TPA: substrate-binding domain-containing protein, partial [Planctomycetota bacterium]|nr:substrate-binding domain-containing protein [Planctomycetota bacterium]